MGLQKDVLIGGWKREGMILRVEKIDLQKANQQLLIESCYKLSSMCNVLAFSKQKEQRYLIQCCRNTIINCSQRKILYVIDFYSDYDLISCPLTLVFVFKNKYRVSIMKQTACGSFLNHIGTVTDSTFVCTLNLLYRLHQIIARDLCQSKNDGKTTITFIFRILCVYMGNPVSNLPRLQVYFNT